MKFLEDLRLKKIAQKEKIKIPENYSNNIKNILNNLEDTNEKPVYNKFRWNFVLSTSMAAILTIFILLPNISSDIAYAMQEIPIIGNLVKIVTIRNYFEKDGYSEIGLEIPNIENNDESYSDANNKINKETQVLINKVIDEYNLNKHPEQHLSIDLKTNIITNTNKWFTLKLTITETSASSNTEYKYYHIDKKDDKFITLPDLFKDERYKDVIKNEISNQMIYRMNENKDLEYWIKGKKEEWDFVDIDENTNFYFSKDGNIVIVFNKYEVGPGAIGTPEFEIDKEIYEKYLE